MVKLGPEIQKAPLLMAYLAMTDALRKRFVDTARNSDSLTAEEIDEIEDDVERFVKKLRTLGATESEEFKAMQEAIRMTKAFFFDLRNELRLPARD